MSKSPHLDPRRWQPDLPASDRSIPETDASGPSDQPPRDEPLDETAVETFRLEVSAGRPTGAGPVEGTQAPAPAPSLASHRIDSRIVEPPDAPSPGEAAKPASSRAADLELVAPANQNGDRTATVARRRTGSRRAAQQSVQADRVASRAPAAPVVVVDRPASQAGPLRRRFPGWIGSLLAHGAFVAILAMQSLATDAPPVDFELSVAPAALDDEFETLDDVQFDSLDEFGPIEEQFTSLPTVDELDAGAASLGEVSSAEALADVAAPGGLGAEGFGDMGGLLEAGGAGFAAAGDGLGDVPPPTFFGQKIEGRRVVFVLDNSGSMQGGRLETVIDELRRCVEALTPRQEFYVIFYSDAVYPLFYPEPAMQFVRPTDRNKRQLARWLETVELCLGDTVDEALAAAASIGPDTVFLLSDGRIQSEKKLRFLLAADVRDFPIHTIGVGMGRSVAGREKLALIAEANGGTFLDRDVPEAMKTLARKSPRPYNNERPGPVWGRNVKSRR